MMAAVLADGITTIHNAAREPEIVDLANFLRSMGARIHGDGTSTLTIDGVPALRASRRPYPIMGDRIEAATYAIAAVMTKGTVTLTGAPVDDLSFLCNILQQAGATVEIHNATSMTVSHTGAIQPVSVVTSPHPGFATDMQAQWMALMSMAEGTSTITEKIFENRFMHVPELTRLGASVSVDGRVASIQGVDKLSRSNCNGNGSSRFRQSGDGRFGCRGANRGAENIPFGSWICQTCREDARFGRYDRSVCFWAGRGSVVTLFLRSLCNTVFKCNGF